MNALNITEDLIRRFPYAVNPSRISADLEALIGQDMKASAKAEGHTPLLPRNPQPNAMDALQRCAVVQASIFRHLMKGPCIASQIANRVGGTRAEVDRALAVMVADGRLEEFDGRRGVICYRINGSFGSEAAQ